MDCENTSRSPFQRAVEACGGQAGLAKRLTEATGHPVSQQRVFNVIRRGQRVPAEWCVPIEQITADKADPVSRHELRPDVFPQEAAA